MELDQEVERDPASLNKDRSQTMLLIPWRKPPSKASRVILLPATASVNQMRPIRAERRADLIKSIAPPELVSAAVTGRLPRAIGVAALRDAPAEWSQQLSRLGLAPNRQVETERREA